MNFWCLLLLPIPLRILFLISLNAHLLWIYLRFLLILSITLGIISGLSRIIVLLLSVFFFLPSDLIAWASLARSNMTLSIFLIVCSHSRSLIVWLWFLAINPLLILELVHRLILWDQTSWFLLFFFLIMWILLNTVTLVLIITKGLVVVIIRFLIMIFFFLVFALCWWISLFFCRVSCFSLRF